MWSVYYGKTKSVLEAFLMVTAFPIGDWISVFMYRFSLLLGDEINQ